MENEILIYFSKVAISSAFFYILYIACLKKDKFLGLRRFYFLFIILFSFIFPFFTIETNIAEAGPIPSYWLPQAEINPAAQQTSDNSYNIPIIGLVIFSTIALLFLVRLIIRLNSIYRLKKTNNQKTINDVNIIILNQQLHATPFSFLRWIFIPEQMQDTDIHEVILHEQEHIRQLHSIDVLIYELFCILLWWNPFAWLLRHEMKINLEYLADQGVLDRGVDTQAYQYSLLHASNRNTGISIVNNFNVSQLKKRIIMMNKKHTPSLFSAKYLLVIPIAIVLLLGNAVQASPELIKASTNSIENSLQQKKTRIPSRKQGDVYIKTEQMPAFPGGEQAMMKYISDNLKYPTDAFENGTQGRVVIRFIVSATGEINNVELIRGIGESCDKEAIRVVKAMPKWTPGKEKGKEVAVYYTIPIVFRLTDDKPVKTTNQHHTSQNDKLYSVVEQMPAFPGGEKAMMKYISDNLKYPESAQTNGVQGRIVIRFVVSASGEINDVELMRGIDDACDQEAIRVVKAMPKWTPGKLNGKEVAVYYTLPIVFNLKKDDKKTETTS